MHYYAFAACIFATMSMSTYAMEAAAEPSLYKWLPLLWRCADDAKKSESPALKRLGYRADRLASDIGWFESCDKRRLSRSMWELQQQQIRMKIMGLCCVASLLEWAEQVINGALTRHCLDEKAASQFWERVDRINLESSRGRGALTHLLKKVPLKKGEKALF